MIYGRFNGEKAPSSKINHQQTIEAIKNSGAKKVIGTFVVGGIKRQFDQGTTYIIDDFIGMGNYDIDWDFNYPFHNAEMIQPFCPKLVDLLERASVKADFPVVQRATYVCFNGYPRIETRAELKFYEMIGADCVGQTLDPEATLCRLNGLCYAAVAVQIDSPSSRREYAGELEHRAEANPYKMSIEECRSHSEFIIREFLKIYRHEDCGVCAKLKRTNNNFREFPKNFYD